MWVIHSWNLKTSTGTIRSPHFKPIPFGPLANIQNVNDFNPGESVLIKVDGRPPNLSVIEIIPTHERQPTGTKLPIHSQAHGYSDYWVEDSLPGTLRIWMGSCCVQCRPNAPHLVFEGVTTDELSEVLDMDDAELGGPLFRLASEAEIQELKLNVPEGAIAYCVVTCHGNGPDGPKAFVVARSIRVEPSEE